MKAVLALSALVAVAAAQSSSGTPTATLSPQASCALACPSTDICCHAACAGVPCPDEGQANDTTECAAACEQGDGSEADTKAYGDCQQACISSLFLTATATRPVPTAPSAPSVSSPTLPTGTDSPSGNDSSDESTPTGSGSGTASPTGSETGDDSSSETDKPTGTGPDGAESTGGDSAATSVKIPIGASALGAMTFILAALAF